ncbi:MAG: hypothetical protein LBD22_01750 [Spirochaetaceae bacterium]|jgi:hypothetical protein|nr:hypothetical protein [Spirochaetaceae bacterium]
MKYLPGILCTVFGIALGACSEFNPSFSRFLERTDETMRNPSIPKGTGTFSWDIRFPPDELNPQKSYVNEMSSYFTLRAAANGTDVLKLPSTWLNSTVGQAVGGPVKLPAGSYFLHLHLANDYSYVLDTPIITITNNGNYVYYGSGNGNQQAYIAADFTPYAKLTANLTVVSDVPVTPVSAELSFHRMADASDAALPKPGGDPDIRKFSLTALKQSFSSVGWTALPEIGNGDSEFYAKIIIIDIKNRRFTKISQKFITQGQTVTVSLGDSAHPVNLLSRIVVHPATGNGTVRFGSMGTDGVYYSPAAGYGGAETECWVTLIAEPAIQHDLNGITVTSSPQLDSAHALRSSSTAANEFEFIMPKIDAGTTVTIDSDFFQTPAVVRAVSQTSIPNSIIFGYYTWLDDAVRNSTGTQTLKLLKDIVADTGSTSEFVRGGSGPITISDTQNITLISSDSLIISRGASYTDHFFDVEGELTLVADSGKMLILDGGSQNTVPLSGNAPLRVAGGTATLNQGVIIRNNRTPANGGGIIVEKGSLKMYGGSIEGNAASGAGGGVYLTGSGSPMPVFEFSGGAITANTAAHGGGVAVENMGGSAVFAMNGTAVVTPTPLNDVALLDAAAFITITGGLTGASPAARITPSVYPAASTTVKVLDAVTDALILANFDRFTVTDQAVPALRWAITPLTGINRGGFLAAPVISAAITTLDTINFPGGHVTQGTKTVTVDVTKNSAPLTSFNASGIMVEARKGGVSVYPQASKVSGSNQFSFALGSSGNYEIFVTLQINNSTIYSGSFTLNIP